MPHLLKNKMFWLGLGGLGLAVLGSVFWTSSGRSPASNLPAPHLRVKPWAESTQGKVGQAMEIKVTAVGGVPDRDDQEIRLRAEVKLNQAIDNDEVNFRWVLPPGAVLVSGETEDSWSGLKTGQTATTEISLLNVSKEGLVKTVSISVGGQSSGTKMGNIGVFATANPAPLEPETQTALERDTEENSAELVLKKNSAAEKMKKVHQ